MMCHFSLRGLQIIYLLLLLLLLESDSIWIRLILIWEFLTGFVYIKPWFHF